MVAKANPKVINKIWVLEYNIRYYIYYKIFQGAQQFHGFSK